LFVIADSSPVFDHSARAHQRVVISARIIGRLADRSERAKHIMTVRSKLVLGLAAGALVIGSVSPAAARGYNGRGRHHDNGPSAGAVFGVLLGVGVIAAIASANARKKQEAENRRYEDDPRYGERADDPRYDRPYDDQRYDSRNDERAYDSGRAYASEDEAVDACAVAARDEASRNGGFAEVRDITGVQPYGGNGFDVTGVVDQRSGYRARDGRARSFRCTYESGRVSGVSFSTAA
jgi:hypothetical protein